MWCGRYTQVTADENISTVMQQGALCSGYGILTDSSARLHGGNLVWLPVEYTSCSWEAGGGIRALLYPWLYSRPSNWYNFLTCGAPICTTCAINTLTKLTVDGSCRTSQSVPYQRTRKISQLSALQIRLSSDHGKLAQLSRSDWAHVSPSNLS